MDNNTFFDTSALKQEENKSRIFNISSLKYQLREKEGVLEFFIEHQNHERLNATDLKQLVKDTIISQGDRSLMEYVSHKLGTIQTIMKVVHDFDFFFNLLFKTSLPAFYNGEEVKFSQEELRLNFNFKFDENSNVVAEHDRNLKYFFGLERCVVYENNTFYFLSSGVPLKVYKQLFEGHNKFSVELFLSLKDTLLTTLGNYHEIILDDKVRNLENISKEQKKAPIVLQIGKTTHFITFEFFYKVGGELFSISGYKYLETVSWPDKKTTIKSIFEENKLIEYVSDLELSEDIWGDLFEGLRVKANPSPKNPFALMLPLSALDPVVHRVIPRAQELYDIEYKDGQSLSLTKDNVYFELETNLQKRLNLLEFKVKFKVGEEYVNLDFLKNLLLQNKKFVQLKNGTTLHVENVRDITKWIEFLQKYEFKKNDETYTSQSSAALELDEFIESFEDTKVTSNDEYKELILEMKDKKPVDSIALPKGIETKLRDYQKEGVYWLSFLRKYGFGGILADEMGLGKTVQALTILEMFRNEGLHMVICPKTLLYNWESEVKKFFPNLKVLIIDGSSEKRKKLIKTAKRYNLVITSYSMLQKDYIEYVENNVEFEYKILDEAHYVKNMKTLSAKAVRLVSAKNRILLTGTPLENNLEELYGTFDLIMPGYLGTHTDFRRDFVSKIERNNAIALELLQAKIRPFILRRTKQEVLKELPEKQEQVVYNEMTNKQIALYNEVLNRVKTETFDLVEKQGFEKSRLQILSALLKLRQICNHPSLIDKSFLNTEKISGKYEQFLELLTEVIDSGEKVLVFSQFTTMLDVFEDDLKKDEIKYLRLDGSSKKRQEIVEEFNENKEIPVFLISLKAGGVGLNLTSASAVFLYDPWWNPMAEKQAVDRAHRIGQKKRVNIYKFITKDSIEEKILKLQERKGNLFENLVVEDNGFMKKLEWEDLMELFD